VGSDVREMKEEGRGSATTRLEKGRGERGTSGMGDARTGPLSRVGGRDLG